MQCSAESITGKVREENEDSIFFSTEPVGGFENLFIVADGMGGHKGGKYASHFVVDKMKALLNITKPEADPELMLRCALELVNQDLFQEAANNEDLNGMGTTLVLATVKNDMLHVMNVGDSRLYLFRDGKLEQITRDHSWVEELVAEGKLERDSLMYNQRKNVITRAVGIMEQVDPDFFRLETRTGDRFLLCSDGLTNMVEDEQIAQILTDAQETEQAVQLLTQRANDNGGADNISIVLTDMNEQA